ncbi:hypothetical protein [Chryseobacterium phocaeense]|uniref:hypothetical protein n=1 Tax=Chryseobacterium phocaeense TaxID=1816690 RepID=UPI0009BA8BF7|nr:hypothetical protein [Chryseobacterium phocaeense]
MKRPISLLLLLFFFCASSQVSKRTAAIIKPVEKYRSFGENEQEKKIEEQLYKEASPEELVFLTGKGRNVYIKAMAVNALAKKGKGKELLEAFKKNLYAKEKITYRTTCLASYYLLDSHIYEVVSFGDNFSEKEKEILQRDMISLALNARPVNKELLEALSYGLSVNTDDYGKIRKLVTDTKSPLLLTSLAKYKNPDDIELIKSFGAEAYPAIEEFPDPKFLPFMNEHFEDSSSFPFMFALSGFCSEEAKKIVAKVIEYNKEHNKERDCDNGCLSFLYQQIEKGKCTLNYPLLADLWLTDKIISFNVLDDYVKTHTQAETEKFLLDGFLKPGEAEIIAVNAYDMGHVMDYVSGDMTFDATLRLVRLLQKTKEISQNAYEIAVRNSLQNIDDLDVDSFILKLKDNTLILQNKDILLDRIKNNESAYGILNIMDGVKALGDKKLFNDGAAIVVGRKEEFKSFAIWETKYRSFMKENNIKE